ncbi:MAG: hypothetical protein IJL64_00965, partial [Bacteroidales bacterium]|nr:hypothetical protein [Bacteroidales bacterium]
MRSKILPFLWIALLSVMCRGMALAETTSPDAAADTIRTLQTSKAVPTDSLDLEDAAAQAKTTADSLASDDIAAKAEATADSLAHSAATALQDSTQQPSKKKSGFDEIIDYKAADSISFSLTRQSAVFYHESDIKYGDVAVTADTVRMEMDKKTIHAWGGVDSLGNVVG